MSHSVSTPDSAISQAIEKLRSLTQISIQSTWRYWDGELPIAEAVQPESWKDWAIADLNARNHIAWAKGRQVRWLGQTITVPADLQGYPLQGLCLRLALTWWAESAQIFVNGQLVQEGDLFDCSTRLLLSPAVTPGETLAITLRLVSPGHDDGALVKSRCLYESPSPDHPLEPGFIADELAVLHRYLETFAPEKLVILSDAIAQIDWSTLPPPSSPLPSLFNHSLTQLRDRLLPLSPSLKQRKIYLLGHAHLDMAWLWTVEETWKAAERTFESVLTLQQDFPELIFCHSTPALYEWIEQNRPDLFASIQQQVKAGKWEPIGGLWVEPELNLISGEAIARHILYGQRYFQEKFGSFNRIAWLPDTFGFNWQLPQFLKQGGIDYFVTQKLRWNDTTQFPYELFQWQSPDGSQILSLMSAPIGEGIDPVKMATYACDWETKTGIPFALWLPGVGDHGGGPTRDMLEIARRWQQSPFFPRLEFISGLAFLEQVERATGGRQQVGEGDEGTKGNSLLPASQPASERGILSAPASLPRWNSELYLEFHRGCYTTHADQKRFNQNCEQLLYQAELWASLAAIAADLTYPKADLEAAWKQVLFNQFHDILPGSSIPEVFQDANQAWEAAQATGIEIVHQSLLAIARQIKVPAPPTPDARLIIVFNSLNWARSEMVSLDLAGQIESEDSDMLQQWEVRQIDGLPVALQHQPGGNAETQANSISFLAAAVPPIGYRCFWLCPCHRIGEPATPTAESFVLENEFLRVTVNSETGDLSGVFDKIQQREVLNGAGNQLQAFQDRGQYWDAWNIDPHYADYPLPPTELLQIAPVDPTRWGNLKTAIAVKRQVGCSIFEQTYILEAGCPGLKIHTRVDWRDRHTLVKAAFPLNIAANHATCDIPCGAIQRTTQPQTEAETAQWEVPALHWADLSDGTYGISLLSDYKHGFDCQPSQIRLTLLRGSEWPDPDADRGFHSFTYTLYPHAGNWQSASTLKYSYELVQPLQTVCLLSTASAPGASLPPAGQLLNLGVNSLVIMAFKPSEANPKEYILRCYEGHGETTGLCLQSDLPLRLSHSVDLLERPTDSAEIEGQTVTIHPWKVVSFKVSTP